MSVQPPVQEPQLSSDERTMGMLAHLLGLFLGVIGPLIIWLIKKDQSTFVNDQGKEALNFQITVLIALVACSVLSVVVIGALLMPIVGIADLVLIIMASIAANNGQTYRYPVNIRFIK
jgi:uncharacterized Tic20 family protein